MNRILSRTHDDRNIDLLKARDAFFDRARAKHHWYLLTVSLPFLAAALSYVPYILTVFPKLDDWRDFLVGLLTLVFLILGYLLRHFISEDLTVSNMLRELYDCRVFGLKCNPYLYDFGKVYRDGKILASPEDIDFRDFAPKIRDAWRKRAERADGKYEAWYGETFSRNERRNILCSQMDNVVFTHRLYGMYMKYILAAGIALAVFSLTLLFVSMFVWKSLGSFLLIMFSLTGLFQMLVDMYQNTSELIQINRHIIEFVRDNVSGIKDRLEKSDDLLRSFQDVIARNRDLSLFGFRCLYNKCLDEYREELADIKQSYYQDADEPVALERPGCAKEIAVFAPDGREAASLAEIHTRLYGMLREVDAVLREAGIPYVLDGGTLIGVCRRGHDAVHPKSGFVFWDDDIDIALPYGKLAQAVEVLEKKLGGKYHLQDYANEPAYSPRLSSLRIRDRNENGILWEKDSGLFDMYRHRGLFLDVYTYHPILVCPAVDAVWRLLFIHPLNRKIRRVETKWRQSAGDDRVRIWNCFQALKKRYLRRVDRYVSCAKCEAYLCYTPNYIHDLKKPGPYFRTDALFGAEKTACFEDADYPIPSEPETVLTAYYGKNWNKPPFSATETLLKEDRVKLYTDNDINISVLKHYKYLDLPPDQKRPAAQNRLLVPEER